MSSAVLEGIGAEGGFLGRGSAFTLAEGNVPSVRDESLVTRDVDVDSPPVTGVDPDLDFDDLDGVELEDDWDSNISLRSIVPEVFENQLANAVAENTKRLKKLRRRNAEPGLIPAISFNVHLDVVGDDPRVQRKNNARLHWEYFCNYRSPREDFNIRLIYDLLTEYLKNFGATADWCSGPGDFCTKVWCQGGYFVEVCNYGFTPWQVRCEYFMAAARDLVMAKANTDDRIWEAGFPERPRSRQQEINDRKKMCINHESVYQPEAIGIAFWNSLPNFMVRLSYGYPSSRVKCENPGIQATIHRAAASQKQYLEKWYDKKQLLELDGSDKEGTPNPKPSTPKLDKNPNSTAADAKDNQGEWYNGQWYPLKGSVNDTDMFGLPYWRDPDGVYPNLPNLNDENGYYGPPLSNYDIQDFMVPDSEDGPETKANVTTKGGPKANAMKPAGEMNIADDEAPKVNVKPGDPKINKPTKSIRTDFPPPMWRPSITATGKRKPVETPHNRESVTFHWSIDTAVTAHASKGVENRPSPKPEIQRPNRAGTAMRPTSAITTAPATKTTGAARNAKTGSENDVPAATPTAKPLRSGEASAKKVEHTSAKAETTPEKAEPTSAKDKPTAVDSEATATKKGEPSPSKSDATPSEAEPAPEKDEAKPTSAAKDEAKPTSAPKGDVEPTPAPKDEVKPTSAPKDEAKHTSAEKDETKPTSAAKDEDKPTSTAKDEAKHTSAAKGEAKPTQTAE
ncbi:hypothetical protein TWF481_002167 [Arthrobotrys musiformis]|uniref:Uncharacterized protein n=1 Tax=Arthrobotrys musiformis TaxID=47236 RepID=A0AAV9VTM2_9PEZI